jgi:hypothetical protein
MLLRLLESRPLTTARLLPLQQQQQLVLVL